MTRLSRPAALAAIALSVAASAGCSVTNPLTTQLAYSPADGTFAQLSVDVSLHSVLIAAAEAEGPGNLIARVVNDGVEPATVQLTGTGDADVDVTVRVPPRSTVGIGPEADEQYLVEPVGEVPGGLIPVTAALEGGGSVEMEVPVLDATLEEYAPLVPDPEIVNPV